MQSEQASLRRPSISGGTMTMAVVDQYCRVKGIQGLWVVDASVMPRIPRSGGAHATVIMIGERVVDWIASS
jgi:choline dehydrogenase-like flavoprotein